MFHLVFRRGAELEAALRLLDDVKLVALLELEASQQLLRQDEPDRISNLLDLKKVAFDFATLGPALRIVGNLPYNISTPTLFHLARFAPQVRQRVESYLDEVATTRTAGTGSPNSSLTTTVDPIRATPFAPPSSMT